MTSVALLSLAPLACRGREPSLPAGSLVLAEAPEKGREPKASTAAAAPADVLDGRYPGGSRVALAAPPFGQGSTRSLSEGLLAAGEPCVSPDGRRVVFAGKERSGEPWQVFEASIAGGAPRRLTDAPGGASSPALLADGTLVYVSPVQRAGEGWFPPRPSALWSLPRTDGPARRLTFGASSVADPTVLADGRILFVAAQPGSAPPRLALFAVNNDGTGVMAYAAQHDGAAAIRRPRELFDGRVAFIASDEASRDGGGRGESVLSARPFRSRGPFLASIGRLVSVEPVGKDEVLVSVGSFGTSSGSVLRVTTAGGTEPTAAPLLGDPGWSILEAVSLAPRPKSPMGRLSTVDPKKSTGVLLCLDARRTERDDPDPAVSRVRILVAGEAGPRPLGEIPLAADGSFLAEVPADVPLGIEALGEDGRVLRTLAPWIWVRPGESRGCIGCHEPHGVAPRNRRPLAVKAPPVNLAVTVPARAPGGAR